MVEGQAEATRQAGDAHERFGGHRQALERALAAGPRARVEGARNLAVYADLTALLAP